MNSTEASRPLERVLQSSLELDASFTLACSGWPGLRLGGFRPALQIDGRALNLVASALTASTAGARAVYVANACIFTLEIESLDGGGYAVLSSLQSRISGTLNHVHLLVSESAAFGADPSTVRVMILSRYGGDVLPLAPSGSPRAPGAGEPNQASPRLEPSSLRSDNVMVIYDRSIRSALLVGFLASERWEGRITLDVTPQGNGHRLDIGFDGGDLALGPGDDLTLEPFAFMVGDDPWSLLERYGDLVRARHGVTCPDIPPVSWCSWYPYRLGVTEDRLLAEARTAAQRLKPLGLSIIEADLGWERQHLPNAFEPNAKFPHGLRWLSDQLAALGFRLGVWKAPFTISAFDDLPAVHPEWVIQGEDERPLSVWTWFWEPHGDVYILDLTHPGALQWLRERLSELREAGIGYLKADFIGMVSGDAAKRRYDARIVAGAGTEAARTGARVIRDELPDALLLNCGGPPMPGTGAWPLLYTCNDTGNTGLQSWEFMRSNFRAVACHLWQNHRWGIIQSSCLCVGLPGAIEEARLRATAVFLSGGQIDISDALTTLPEDRWAVLQATLPPLGLTARPVDLFEPIYDLKASDYEALCRGLPTPIEQREHPPGSVWHLQVTREWDTWDLIACFAYDQGPANDRPDLTNFTIPLNRVGLEPEGSYWAHEFWSGQFLGTAPGWRTNPDGYAHPGDWQDLLTPGPPGALSLSFTGPGVKLLALRRVRPHPWVVGSTFHQSCGAELTEVAWDPYSGILSGRLSRPAGECGALFITGAGWTAVGAEVSGRPTRPILAPHAAWRIPIVTSGGEAAWSVHLKESANVQSG
ncbi:MAG: alpha-galactosidase [Anaerolineae bacterium]|nr:alpha-galactosidase [Anaerolineae bacterium]